MKRPYFTRHGFDKLRRETAEVEARLQEIQGETASVAEFGGDQWHDNAGYDHLVIDIRGLDRRLSDMRRLLEQAIIVETPTNLDRVAIGTCVKIRRNGTKTELEITGFGESEPGRNALAYNTPLATLIIGKRIGEITKGVIAGKETEIEILEITKGEGGEDVHSD